MQSISQLEVIAAKQPNSIEINQALADAYAQERRWEEAARTYRSLALLYPDTAALFINRIRLGAAALMVSSVLFFIAEALQPSIVNKINPSDLSRAISSPQFLFSQSLFLLAFALYSCSAISIYKLLSYTRDHRPAFWAMVFSVIGIGLSMPSLGINMVVLPLIGRLYLEGKTDVLALYSALQQNSFQLILGFGGYLVISGVAIFAWVIWRNETLSLAPALVYLLGWILFAQTHTQYVNPILIVTGTLLLIGGIGLGRSLWIQASTQFDPKTDRSLRS